MRTTTWLQSAQTLYVMLVIAELLRTIDKCRLAVPYPINVDDLIELQNTVYRVFQNQSDIILPGSLLGNYSSLQAATQNGIGG